jgi:hypothetical protein
VLIVYKHGNICIAGLIVGLATPLDLVEGGKSSVSVFLFQHSLIVTKNLKPIVKTSSVIRHIDYCLMSSKQYGGLLTRL